MSITCIASRDTHNLKDKLILEGGFNMQDDTGIILVSTLIKVVFQIQAYKLDWITTIEYDNTFVHV